MAPKKYRKVSEKITISMAGWLILITLLGTLASYWHVSTIVTTLIKENLQKYVTVRGERESQNFTAALSEQAELAALLQRKLSRASAKDEQRFHLLFEKKADGSYREKNKNYLQHAQIYIPPYVKVDSTFKKRTSILYEFLENECFLTLISFNDCWIGDAYGSFAMHDRTETGYNLDKASEYNNLDQVWMQGSLPANNPSRLPHWTKSYLDPNVNAWMVSLATPIYLQDEFIGSIGNDILIGKFLERIVNFKIQGTKNFVFDDQGYLIANSDFQDKIIAHHGLLHTRELRMEASAFEETYLLALEKLPSLRGDLQGKAEDHVFDLNSEYIVALTRLDGPRWYLAILYPKALISKAALKSSQLILFLGGIGLLLELILLGRLISEKLGRPMNELMVVVDKVSAGDIKAKVNIKTRDEFEILGNAFNEMTYNLDVSRAESQAALDQAVKASKVKTDFVANMNHEMRTPLNAILGMTHFLNESHLSEEQKKYASFIAESGNHLLNIVNQVLDVAKIEEKQYRIEESNFTIERIIEDLKATHFFAAKEKGLPLDFEDNTPDQKRYWGDVNRIKQILSNLISNSIKFSDVGMITVVVNEIPPEEGKSYLQFTVKDQGIGISEDAQEKIFESFTQVESSMSRRFGGAGLGLYLVKSFVQLMGGRLGLKSSLGQGSSFWFEIPVRLEAATCDYRGPAVAPTDLLQNLKPILVVEDNFVNQVLTETLIKKLGYTCEIANDGKMATELFVEGKYSMILMDCQMPIMDGYESTRHIRATESSNQRIPIVALTANTENKDREACLEAGMDDMLSKPVKIAVFKEKLDYWLRVGQKNEAQGNS